MSRFFQTQIASFRFRDEQRQKTLADTHMMIEEASDILTRTKIMYLYLLRLKGSRMKESTSKSWTSLSFHRFHMARGLH